MLRFSSRENFFMVEIQNQISLVPVCCRVVGGGCFSDSLVSVYVFIGFNSVNSC